MGESELQREVVDATDLGIDAGDPVSILRAALERTHVLASVPVVLADPDPVKPPDLTLFELTRFGEGDADFVRDATVSMLGALSAAETELVVWVRGDGRRLRVFWGRLDRGGKPLGKDTLDRALTGFLRGTHIEPIDKLASAQQDHIAGLAARKDAVVIVGVPSDRAATPSARSIDDALDALARTSFDLVIVARPVGRADLDLAENNIAQVINVARGVARSTTVLSESSTFSEALRESSTEAMTLTTTESLTSSAGERRVKTKNDRGGATIGAIAGTIVGGAAGFALGNLPGAKIGALGGQVLGAAIGGAVSPGGQRSEEQSTASATTASAARTETGQRGVETSAHRDRGASRQITFESVVSSADVLAAIAEAHRVRIEQGRGLGMWRTSVRIAADDVATAQRVAHLVIGAIRGDGSHLGPLVALRFSEPSRALQGIERFEDLRSVRPAHSLLPGGEQPETWLTTPELAMYVRPPSTRVATLDVRAPVEFGRWLPPPGVRGVAGRPRCITLGNLIEAERDLAPIVLPIDDLCRHTFVTGTTGSGKTTTVKVILRQLAAARVPFLVLEPAKTEYRDLFDELVTAGLEPLRYVLGKPEGPRERQFRLNPLMAPSGIPVGRHLEAVKTLVLGSFDMHEGLPQAMESLLFRAFRTFQLSKPLGRWKPAPYPTLPGLLGPRLAPRWGKNGGGPLKPLVDEVIDELGYDERVSMNYKAALKVRLRSFELGLKHAIFNGAELDLDEMLSRPSFVELSDLSEPDVRRFVMGAFMLRLYGERESQLRALPSRRSSGQLRHLLVLEEAHHFLRLDGGSGTAAGLARQSNQLLADAFAELRSYGQGILVADQAPAELSTAVLRNTATKIVHTTFHEADAIAIANAIGLDEKQRGELRRLEVGQAVVRSPGVPVPVLCRIESPRDRRASSTPQDSSP